MISMVRRIMLIVRRELGTLFSTPTAYVVLLLFQLLNGLFFSAILYSGAAGNLAYLYRNIALVLLLMVPAVTMDAFVGERRRGTDELLLTSPTSPLQLLIAKFVVYGFFCLIMCLTTVQYPIVLTFFCTVDGGRVLAGTAGLVVLGLAMVALGLCCSALCNHQLSACLSAFATGLVFWCAGSLVRLVSSGDYGVVRSISFFERFLPFSVGLVDSGDCSFFLLVTLAFLTLALRLVERWQWR